MDRQDRAILMTGVDDFEADIDNHPGRIKPIELY